MLGGDPDMREVTLSFSQLTLHFRVTVTPNNTSSSPIAASSVGFELIEGPTPEPFSDRYHISFELEEQALRARTVDQLLELDLQFLSTLWSKLRSTDRVWTPRARVARAFRAGVASRRRLDGEYCEASSPAVPFRNQIYIILRATTLRHGGWTEDYSKYIDIVGSSSQPGFEASSVSHSFASQTEADAYLAGARRPWPPQIQ